jgi:hypothetical protein
MFRTRATPLRPAALALLAASCVMLAATSCGGSDEQTRDSATDPSSSTASADGQGSRAVKQTGANERDFGGGSRSSASATLVGDREEAQAGVAAVDGMYGNLEAAVRAGVSATNVDVREALESSDDNQALTNVCAIMSEEAQKQAITYAKRSANLADVDWTCEKATGILLRRARQTGGLKRATQATVVGVNADGDQATATVRFGGRKGRISTIPLVKEDGQWKLGATPGTDG